MLTAGIAKYRERLSKAAVERLGIAPGFQLERFSRPHASRTVL